MFCYIFVISAVDFKIFEIVAPAEAFSLCSAKIKPKKIKENLILFLISLEIN